MEGVLYKKVVPVHEDDRRALIEAFNGDFTAKQLKVLKIKKDAVLGNHYHPYRQFFYFLKGEAEYIFVNIATGQRQEIKAQEGDFIIIDKNIAHKARQKAGNMMVEGNEQSYTSAAVDDLKYEIS
ncbi:MAG: cupin domain-containing protein [Elusimicrobiota bacterium]|jgi:quercetin dioxygenase-like cupin family protein